AALGLQPPKLLVDVLDRPRDALARIRATDPGPARRVLVEPALLALLHPEALVHRVALVDGGRRPAAERLDLLHRRRVEVVAVGPVELRVRAGDVVALEEPVEHGLP